MLALIDTWDTAIRTWATGLGWPMEAMLRLGLAVVAGGLVGLERELRGRQAGFRTNLLVCLGSALVMIVSLEFSRVQWGAHSGFNITVDPARIAYGVMTGVGFLGAGAILHTKGQVRGLTTAAGMWCVAAIGLSIGFGLYLLAAFATFLVVMVLWFLDYLENLLPKAQYRTMTVRTTYSPGCSAELAKRFARPGLDVVDVSFERDVDNLSQADVHVRIVFLDSQAYSAVQNEIEADPRYQLISVRDT